MSDQKNEITDDLDFDFSLEESPFTDSEVKEVETAVPVDGGAPDKGLNETKRKMALLRSVPVTLTLEVDSVEISCADLLAVKENSVIELDKLAGEPLDIKCNGILFGKAEVVVVNDKYGLHIIEIQGDNLNELAQ